MLLNRFINADCFIYNIHIIHIWAVEKKPDCSDRMRFVYNRDGVLLFSCVCVFGFVCACPREKRNVRVLCVTMQPNDSKSLSFQYNSIFFYLDAGHAKLSTVMALHKTTQSYTREKKAAEHYTLHRTWYKFNKVLSLFFFYCINFWFHPKAQKATIMRCEKAH